MRPQVFSALPRRVDRASADARPGRRLLEPEKPILPRRSELARFCVRMTRNSGVLSDNEAARGDGLPHIEAPPSTNTTYARSAC